MKFAKGRGACAVAVVAASLVFPVAANATHTGVATTTPWTGYWWPYLHTYTYKLYNDPGPMKKYDQATGSTSYSWEYANHRTTDSAATWWGHCQAWAAAAIMEPQPAAKTVNGVSFSQDDVEGLYSETWTRHMGYFYGTRCNSCTKSSDAYKDVHPADFDKQVRYWIGQQKVPLLMDYTPGHEVWNYPVYAYSRSSTLSGSKEYVTMKIWRANTYYNYAGTSYSTRTLYYTLEAGTNGVWSNPSGSSHDTHPDYIVKVTGRASSYGNPNVSPLVLDSLFR